MIKSFIFIALFLAQVQAQTPTVPVSPTSQQALGVPPFFLPSTDDGVRPWRAPNYQGQESALGYVKDLFDGPPEFQSRVKFWIDIYSKYTSEQGVLHDRYDLGIVYDSVDFADINQRTDLNPTQKNKLKEKKVDDRRDELRAILVKLSQNPEGKNLSSEEQRIFKIYEKRERPQAFIQAAEENRIRFQLGQANQFKKGIFYSGRYLERMENIFRDEGLPLELTRLPFVESSFNLFARSRVGASGIWQFMRTTGRMYMKVNDFVDERNDPLRATRAAARKMKENYQLLEAWPLAITAYNHGPAGVHRIVKALGTKDLNVIIEKNEARRFGFASENFYACFLAAIHVEKNATKYFPDVQWGQELNYEEVKIEKPIKHGQLVFFFDGNAQRAELYNPHFGVKVRKGQLAIPAGTVLRLPPEVKSKYLASIGRKKPIVVPEMPEDSYKVQVGDTLTSIAEKHKIPLETLMSANKLTGKAVLRADQILRIPQ